MSRVVNHPHAGYTLIELLLYVAILGSLLISISLYFGLTAEARLKNQSIAEVNQQGALIMDRIAQTVRNADAITIPATGVTGTTLSLTVPTGSLSPTVFNGSGTGGGTVVLGYDQDGGTTSELNANTINATKFVAGVSGTTTTLWAFVGPIGLTPNNRAQMAIYSGASTPTTLLANSVTKILTGNTWNSFTIASTAITAGETYWLAYNTNALSSTENNLRYHLGTSGQARSVAQTYGTWPASWVGGTQNLEFSVYADVTASGGTGTMRIQEGAGSVTDITNSKVVMSNLTFKNLTRPSTPGTVQVSFTLARVNANNRNEYDFQKTFTTTISVRQ